MTIAKALKSSSDYSSLKSTTSKQLDSIRALSAYIVLIGHAHQFLIAPAYAGASKYVGLFTQAAVMIFFVLSGFMIGRSLINNTLSNERFDISNYFLNRAARLYPALILSTVTMCALWWIAPFFFETGTRNLLPQPNLARTAFLLDPKEIMGSLAFLNGFTTKTPNANGPLWSLPLEVWYYVIGAAIFTAPSRPLISIGLLGATFWITKSNSLFLYFMPVWASGLLVAVFAGLLNKVHALIYWAALVALTAWSTTLAIDFLSTDPLSVPKIQAYAKMAGFTFTIYMILIVTENTKFTEFGNKAANHSYTLYIIHMPILLFILGSFQSTITEFLSTALLASVLSCIAISQISFQAAKIVENKTLLKRLIRIGQPRTSRNN